MGDCRYCGAPIRWAVEADSGQRVMLDLLLSRYSGPGRYRPLDDDPAVVVPIDDNYQVSAYSGHDETCSIRLRS